MKTDVCVFMSLTVKAELVTDLTSHAFLASFSVSSLDVDYHH